MSRKALGRHGAEEEAAGIAVGGEAVAQALVVGVQVVVVAAHGADDAAGEVALGDQGEEGGEEVAALGVVGGERPQLLELVDDQEQGGAGRAGQAQRVADRAGIAGADRRAEGEDHLRGDAGGGGGALGALDQALERVGAGAHLDHVPLAGLGAAAEGIGQRTLAEGRDQAGLDQGGLARAAVAGDQDQVRGPQPVDQGLGLLAPAEEQGGVLGLERLQAHEGLRHQPDGLGGVEAGGDADEVGEAAAVLGQAHALILLREGRQVGEVARVVGDDRDEGVGAALRAARR